MKRITLVILLFLLTGVGYSQYTENFESGIPTDWAVFNNGFGSNTWTTSTTTVCEGTTAAFMNARQNIGSGNTSENWLVTKQVAVPANGQLFFSTRSTISGPNDTTYQIRLSTTSQTNTGSFITIQSWTEAELNATFNVCEDKQVNLAGFAGNNVYIAFVIVMNQPTAGLTGDRWIVDDVRLVEQCIDPENIVVTGITQTSAIISWDNPGGATEFEVSVVPAPGAAVPGTVTSDNPYLATGLSPTTQYQVYVRAKCEFSFSEWIGPVNFITTSPGQSCNSAIQVATLPYSTTDNTANYQDDVDGSPGATGCGTTGTFLNGNNVYYSYTATTTGVINLTMTPTGNNAGMFVYNSCANVGVSCVAGAISVAGAPIVIDLPVTQGQTYYIVISTNGNPNTIPYTLSIQVVNCPPPTNLTAVGGQISAILGWDANGAASWEYAVQLLGGVVPPGAGIQTNDFQNVTVTNLLDSTPIQGATQYQYWVRRDCGDGTFSAWAGPFPFNTTVCEPADQCIYTFRMTDSFGDGWNGARMQIRQNGIVIATIGETFTAGAGPVDVQVSLCNNLPFDLFWSVGGTFAGEVRVEIFNSPAFNQSLYAMTVASAGLVNSVLYAGTVDCLNPACLPPAGVVVNNISDTSASVGWTPIPGVTEYEVIILPTGSPAPTAASTGTVTSDNPFALLGLTSATIYDVYVRAICSTPTPSNWSAVTSFNTTICDISDQCNYTFRMTDSFGDGWNGARMQVRQNGIVVATIGATFTAGAGPIDVIVPLCNNLPFDLFWSVGGTFAGEVRVAIINNFAQQVFNMNVASAGLVGTVLYTDNLVECLVPECLPPSGVAISAIGDTSANVSWNPIAGITDFEVIVLPTGSPAPTAGSTGTVTSDNPFTITGLTAATIYDVYVRAICTTGPSNWTTVTSFNTTICALEDQCLYTFRMRDSFGDGWNGARMQVRQNGIVVATIGATFNAGAGPIDIQVPLCNNLPFDLFWSVGGTFAGEVRVEIINPFTQSLYNMNVASAGLVGTVLYTGTVDCLNPECVAPLAVVTSNIGINQVSVGWNPNGGTDFEVIAVPAGSPAPTAGTPGVLATSNPFVVTGLNPGTAYDFYVRALCTGANPFSAWAGPATATTLPTCPAPINLIVIGADTNTATISWTNIAPATLFEVVVQPVGSGIPTVAGVITSDNPYTATGLSAGFYEFYVRAICSSTDQSAWAGPQNFFILATLPGCAGVDIDLQTSTPGVLNLCPGENCVDLSASFFETGDTTTYDITSIPFTPPFPFTGGIPTSVNTDDVWTPVIDLPFNFCFFGQNYTKALVGSNGVITFDIQGVVPGGAQVPSGYCAWPFTQTIPNAGFPIKAAIYGPYQDINPNVTTPPAQPSINYQILGTAPCRVLVVNYSEVAQFSCNTNVPLQTSQIVLYETSNAIEVYVQNRVPCLTWNSGNGVIGIQNQAGTQAHVPPGRNTGTWSASNEAWRFTPAGPSNVSFSWLKDGEFYSNDLSINVCVSETTSMTAQAIYTACGGEETITTDTILLNIIGTELPVQDDVTVCATTGYVLPELVQGNYFTEPGGQGTPLIAGDIITENTTIYVYLVISGTNGDCTSEGSFDVIMTDEIVPEFDTIPAEVCQNGTAPTLPPTSLNGINGLWTPSTVDTSVEGTLDYVFEPFGSEECAASYTTQITILPFDDVLPIEDVTACNSYVLPELSVGTYYTDAGGLGLEIPSGTEVIESTTLYVYAENGICSDEESFMITINSVVVDVLENASACESYTLPVLSANNAYYTEAGGLGTMLNAGDVITTTQTIYIYTESGTTPNCVEESSFVVTIGSIVLDPIEDVSACDSYILPTLPQGNYFTGIGGTGDQLNAGDIIESTQLIYVYAADDTCVDEISFTVTINTISVDVIADQTACDTYTLPVLSVNNSYYTEAGGLGTILNAGDVITSTQTIYIYAQSGTTPNCTAESSFVVTIGNITLDPIADVIACDSYVLPALTLGNYFTAPGGTGDQLNAGDTIGSTQLIYVYAADGTCEDEISFTVTINTISVDVFTDQTACDSFTLTALNANNAYYTEAGGLGTMLNAGDVITTSQTIYIYAQSGTTPNCTAESSFVVTINITPQVLPTSDVIVCDSYTLPALTVGNYYTAAGGTGTMLNAGDVITTTQTIFVYAATGTTPNCFSEVSFVVTVNIIVADVKTNVEACDSYTLPTLNSNNAYYTGQGGTGTQFVVGSIITTSQTIYIYAQSGTTPNCTDESSFVVTINVAPTADVIPNATACLSDGGYELPALSSGNTYYTGPGGTGQQLNPMDDITESQTIYVYAQSGTTPNCFNETSFSVTIVEVMAQDLSDVEECGSYTLPELNAGNGYYTGPNGTGTQLQPGSDVTTSQLIYVYATNNGCSAQTDFQVTINGCLIQKGISPNNDGSNDFFDLVNFNVSKLEIFNRYGTKVYSKNNYENEWYGQSDKGDELPDGTYYYVIYFNEGTNATGWIYINRVR
jgi:gliding motility-associated-like protein